MKTQCYIPLGFFLTGKGKSNLASDLAKKLHFELLLLFWFASASFFLFSFQCIFERWLLRIPKQERLLISLADDGFPRARMMGKFHVNSVEEMHQKMKSLLTKVSATFSCWPLTDCFSYSEKIRWLFSRIMERFRCENDNEDEYEFVWSVTVRMHCRSWHVTQVVNSLSAEILRKSRVTKVTAVSFTSSSSKIIKSSSSSSVSSKYSIIAWKRLTKIG